MSDDRFSDPNVFKKPGTPKDWDGTTLDQWVELALNAGQDELVTALIQTLPEASRGRYREIWKRVKGVKPDA